MCDFNESSQLREWMFTSETLKKCRAKANLKAREYLAAAQASGNGDAKSQVNPVFTIARGFTKQQQEEAQKDDDPTKQGPWKTASDHPFLTPEEEAILVTNFVMRVPLLVGPKALLAPGLRNCDIKVTATAAMLLRRFYLSNSVMLHDPKTVMIAAGFAACKIEDSVKDIRYFEDGANLLSCPVTQAELLPTELAFMEGICFQLLCFHPFKPLQALTEDLRTFLKSEKGMALIQNRRIASADLIAPLYNAARLLLDDVIISDIPLLFTPGQIGLAAMMVANDDLQAKQAQKQQQKQTEAGTVEEEEGVVAMPSLDMLAYVRLRFSEEQGNQMAEVMKVLVPMVKELREGKHGCGNHNINMAEIKKIHKRLKKCRGWGKKEKKSKKRSSANNDGGDGEGEDQPKKKKAKA